MHLNWKFVFALLLSVFVCFEKFGISCYLNETHAIILARGGSKAIKHKNLLQLNGVSLLGRNIDTIKSSGFFANIWVSTDDESIAAEAIKFGASVYRRSNLYAQDNSTSLDAIKEFLNDHYYIERFALFQCTSVFLKIKYIREAVDKFQNTLCVFAVVRSHQLRWRYTNDSRLEALNFDVRQRPRRQNWNGELIETGMFYFSSRLLTDVNQLQNEKCEVVEINANDAIEIDTMDNVKLVQCLLNVNT